MPLTCCGRAWSDFHRIPGSGLSQHWMPEGKTWQVVGLASADLEASTDREKPQDCLKIDQHSVQ